MRPLGQRRSHRRMRPLIRRRSQDLNGRRFTGNAFHGPCWESQTRGLPMNHSPVAMPHGVAQPLRRAICPVSRLHPLWGASLRSLTTDVDTLRRCRTADREFHAAQPQSVRPQLAGADHTRLTRSRRAVQLRHTAPSTILGGGPGTAIATRSISHVGGATLSDSDLYRLQRMGLGSSRVGRPDGHAPGRHEPRTPRRLIMLPGNSSRPNSSLCDKASR